MKKILSLFGFIFSVSVFSQNVDLYISPDGNDITGDGSKAMPFQTIERTKSILRVHPQKSSSNYTVYLRGGIYPLSSTIIFNENDGGVNSFHVKYINYPNEKPSISGAVKVTGWSKVIGKAYYKATVSNTGFRQLYVNGLRKTRAKTNDPIVGLSWTDPAKGGVIIPSSDLIDLSNADYAEFHMQSEWRDAYVPIDSMSLKLSGWYVFSSKMKQVTTLNPAGATPSYDRPFTIENALELLDQPGEWYCDNSNKILYYYPESSEDINTSEVLIPATERLIMVKGSSKSTPVKNLTFEGVTFCYAGWTGPNKKGWYGYQAGLLVQPSYEPTFSSVFVEYGRNISFKNCSFTKTGAVGLELQNGIYNCNVECCSFYNVGDAGLSVSTFNHNEIDLATEDSCNYIIVNNNIFYRTGMDCYGSPAALAYYVKGFQFTHNEIFDVPYSGLSLGWGWSSVPNSKTCRDNIISNNRIGNYLKICRDGGGTYTLGQQPNSVCSNNYYYNQKNEYGAIYFDEGTSGYTSENNVVENSPRWLHIWTPTINNITINNNYTTTATLTNKGTNITLTNTHLVPDANWNAEAKAIIANAGLNTCTSLRSILPDTTGNKAPVINTPSSYSFSLIENGILEASVSDLTNPYNILNIGWSQKDGPGTITFSSLVASKTKVAFSKAGLYHVILKADDGLLKTSKEITINVSDYNIGNNLALNKPAYSSSSYDTISYLAKNAVDGNINSIWHPAYGDWGSSWWSVDLQTSLFINRIELVTRQAYPQDQTRCQFAILASDSSNFSNNTILGGQGPDTIPYKGTWTLNTDKQTKKYRYLKVIKTADFNHTIAEFKVYNFTLPNTINFSQVDFISAFPNPANDYIDIELPGEKSYVFTIFDINGKLIYSQIINKSEKHRVDITSWIEGLYFINCIGEEKLYRSKFCILR